MINDSYKTLRVNVRPPRVACLIDSNENDWHPKIKLTLEAFSRTWGGAGFIIIPTDGNTIPKPFWEILMSYDPDYFWVSYRTTDRDDLGIRLSDELINQLKLRLAPFHYDDSHYIENKSQDGFLQSQFIEKVTYPNFKADYPFTDSTTLLPNCEHQNQIIEVSNLDSIMQIWVGATTGIASDEYKNELKEIGIESILVDYGENQSRLFDNIVNGVQKALEEESGVFPFAFSKLQLDFYRSNQFFRWQESTLVVVGETLEDFCLYFCLSRMRRKVAWFLTTWIPENFDENEVINLYEDSPLGYFARSLGNLQNEHQQNGTTYFMSASLAPDFIERIRNAFRKVWRISVGDGLLVDKKERNIAENTVNYEETLVKSLEFLLKHPTKLFENENFDKIVSRHFLGSKMAGFFEPPKPKNFSKIVFKHCWVTDFSVVNQSFPRHPLLGTAIVKESMMSHSNARVGKESIAFVDPKTGAYGGNIDSLLRKPDLYLPNAFSIFELLLKEIGYKIEISDKGRFADTTISKFGNLLYFADLLVRSKGTLFDRYLLDGNKKLQDEGLFLKSDTRWYITFNTFKNLFGDENAASTFIDSLLGFRVLHRGLVLKCELCRNTDWYSLAEITNEFQCKRCNLKQIYQKSHALNQLEPYWYYKLDEVVYQAMTHNSIVPILALNYLWRKGKTFDYCSELELRDIKTNEQLLEIDICCIQDGKLTIGEAKVADCLAKNKREENAAITKYFDLSERLGISQVVFATTSEDWNETTKERILNRFSQSLTKIVFLTKKQLYNPY